MEISATQLGAEAIKNTLNKVKLPPSAVEDVMMGLVHLWSFHTFSPRKNNYYWQIWLQTKITIPFKINQTRWNSIYKWTKILTLEITILVFFNDNERWYRHFYFWNPTSPSRSAAAQCKKFCQKGWIGLARSNSEGARWIFKKILTTFPGLFTIIFKPKLVILRVKDSKSIYWFAG